MTEERDFWQQFRDNVAATVEELNELEKQRPLRASEVELLRSMAAALATYDRKQKMANCDHEKHGVAYCGHGVGMAECSGCGGHVDALGGHRGEIVLNENGKWVTK